MLELELGVVEGLRGEGGEGKNTGTIVQRLVIDA